MKLGELFVDLGINAGNSLNTLTTFSIKFLAIKNMAQQLGGVFDGVFGDVARYGQELYNANIISGISVREMQEMKNKAEQLGLSYDTIYNSLRNVGKANADILQGQGNAKPFQKLGIDVSTLRDSRELLDEIMTKILKLEPAFQQTMLAEFGLSEQLLVYYREKHDSIRDSLLLTKEEVKATNELAKTWKYFTQTVGALWDKFIGKSASNISSFLENTLDFFGLTSEEKSKEIDKKNRIKQLEQEIETYSRLKGFDPSSRQAEIDRLNSELNGTYKNPTLANSSSIVINDNSQTTINTTDGPEQYEKIKNDKNNALQSQISNIELLGAR